MKEITCTICSLTTKVNDQDFYSNDMIFDCVTCGAVMKRNRTTHSWKSTDGSKPVLTDSPVKTQQCVPQVSKEKLGTRLDNWG